ncbi:MAG: hypothetical protein ACI9AU_000649 [Bacteroidia bacterium]|jgi:hypothetical protein
MKITLVILGALGLAFVVVQHYLKYNTNSVESQPYEVLENKGGFELRYYPSVNIARITSKSTSYDDMSSNGFRQLAGYIFGGNDKNESIAMTSPVQVDVNDSLSTMSFMMPKKYDINDLPTPEDSNVQILQTDEEYVAVVSFGGFADDAKIKENSDKLARLLKENNLSPVGNFRWFGYNPPYQIIGRKNEIVVKVDMVR